MLRYAVGCQYCDGFLTQGASQAEATWNTVLLETAHFVVVPTLGMLVPGWLLIVPRAHYPSMASLPATHLGELQSLLGSTKRLLEATFARTILFEHGAASSIVRAGACVDHAHWHIVPADFDLTEEISVISTPVKIDSYQDLASVGGAKRGYIFYETLSGEKLVYDAKEVPCQFVRRLIAKRIGHPHDWDWAVHLGLDNIRLTLRLIHARGGALSNREHVAR